MKLFDGIDALCSNIEKQVDSIAIAINRVNKEDDILKVLEFTYQFKAEVEEARYYLGGKLGQLVKRLEELENKIEEKYSMLGQEDDPLKL